MKIEKVKKVLLGLSVVLLALLLRLWHIGSTDIGQDESFSAMCALFPVKDIIYVLTKGDNPPLWEILLHYWMVWFGVSTVAMRMLPLIFNVLTVVPIYLTGVRFFMAEADRLSMPDARRAGLYGGLSAALFFAFSNFTLFFAHEVRVYSLVGLLAAWSLYFFIGWLYRPGRRLYIIGLTVANLLLMYAHYLAIWVIVMQFMLWLSVPRCRKALGSAYLWHLLVLFVLYIPMFPVLWCRFLDSGLHGTWIPKAESLGDLRKLLWGFLNQNNWLLDFVGLMAVSYVVRMVIKMKSGTYKFGLLEILACMWMVPLLISFVLSFRVGFLLDRYFYFVLPPLYLSLAWLGLLLGDWLWRTVPPSGILVQVVILALMLMNLHADSAYLQYDHRDTREASSYLYACSERQEAKFIISPFWIIPKMVYNFDARHELFRSQGKLVGRDVEYTEYLVFRCIYGDYFKPFDFSTDSVIAVLHYKYYEPVHLQKNIQEQNFVWAYTKDFATMQVDFYRKESGFDKGVCELPKNY
ncbi:MAG: hypothetical protein K2F84_01000 [Bacteroidales bacterium]|nr:hypothetical protein [Bacteroidales bacterium]